MIAIGIGARRDATAEEVGAAIQKVEIAAGERGHVIATFTEAPFRDRVAEAAERAVTQFKALALPELRERSGDCRTISERSLALHHVASIAEAAALAAAGGGSRLIVPRLVCGPVTAAAAISKDHKKVAS